MHGSTVNESKDGMNMNSRSLGNPKGKIQDVFCNTQFPSLVAAIRQRRRLNLTRSNLNTLNATRRTNHIHVVCN